MMSDRAYEKRKVLGRYFTAGMCGLLGIMTVSVLSITSSPEGSLGMWIAGYVGMAASVLFFGAALGYAVWTLLPHDQYPGD